MSGHRLPIGFELQNYRIVEFLGEGNFGITYRAMDTHLQRPVAIKEYFPREHVFRFHKDATGGQPEGWVEPIGNPNSAMFYKYGLQSFVKEAQTLARFKHPNIVSVHTYLTDLNNTAYLVMEYVQGQTLQAWLKGRKLPVPERPLLNVFGPLLGGLYQLHVQELIHRDVKPDNIYIRTDGQPVLLDFGATRRRVEGQSKGLTRIYTRGYAPIEQYDEHGNQGAWTDIYAVAACMHYALTGLPVYDAEDREKLIKQGEADPQQPLVGQVAGIAPGFLRVVDQALSRLPEDRPGDAMVFRRALEQSLTGGEYREEDYPDTEIRPIPPVPDPAPVPDPVPEPERRHGVLKFIGITLAGLALSGGGYLAFSSRQAEQDWQQQESVQRGLVSENTESERLDVEAGQERLLAQNEERNRVEAEAERARLSAMEDERVRVAEQARQARLAAAQAERKRAGEEAEQLRLQALEDERVRVAEEARQARLAAAQAERKRAGEEAEQLRLQALEDERVRVAEEARQARLAAAQAERKRAGEEAEQLRLQALEDERIRVARQARLDRLAATLAESSRKQAKRLREAEAERERLEADARRTRIEAAENERQLAAEIEAEKSRQAGKQFETLFTLFEEQLLDYRLTHPIDDNADITLASLNALGIDDSRLSGARTRIGNRYLDLVDANPDSGKVATWLISARAFDADVARVRTLESTIENLRKSTQTASGIKSVSYTVEHPGGLQLDMIRLPAGRFNMGSPPAESGRGADEKLHSVTVRSFAIGQYEVTFEQYDVFARATGRSLPGDRDWGRGRRPVINVSWLDAMAYTVWLARQTGRAFRLPTEAEWEYAARAGTTTPYYTGQTITTDQANFNGGYESDGTATGVFRMKTIPVGSLAANPFGLYDVHGNVWEWTCSAYDKAYGGAEQSCDKGQGGARSLRGGSWNYELTWVRSAFRNWDSVEDSLSSLGFRLAEDVR